MFFIAKVEFCAITITQLSIISIFIRKKNESRKHGRGLKMKPNKKKEIKEFFDKLKTECLKDDVYSVIETAKKMEVSYDQVRSWARSSKYASRILKECRAICWNRSLDELEEEDALTKKLTTTEAVKYMKENNDEFREQQEKQYAESQLWSLKREAERKGMEFPPDKIEEVAMLEYQGNEYTTNKNELVTEKKALPEDSVENIETQRIRKWTERQKITTPSFQLNQNTIEDETGKREMNIVWESTGKNPLTHAQCASSIYAATGSANEHYALNLLNEVAAGCFNSLNKDPKVHAADVINTATGVLLSLAPKDEIEGMLCARLIVLHDQYMQFISRTTCSNQTAAGVDLNINRATKLMRLYNETLDALNKHRRKGEQKVLVQHVNVNDGGQAVVNGQLNQGEGEHVKK